MHNRKHIIITVALLLSVFLGNLTIYANIHAINNRIETVQSQVDERVQSDQEVAAEYEKLKQEQKARDEKILKMQKHDEAMAQLKAQGFSIYSDLSNNSEAIQQINGDDINRIINYWINNHGVSSDFAGKGDAFIQASRQTGMNPIYILAHSAIESGWGSSYIARTKNNFFGINAVDSDPGQSYYMGNSTEEGLAAGALWIRHNFYDYGYTTLAGMKSGNYATDHNWEHTIANVMNTCLYAL